MEIKSERKFIKTTSFQTFKLHELKQSEESPNQTVRQWINTLERGKVPV